MVSFGSPAYEIHFSLSALPCIILYKTSYLIQSHNYLLIIALGPVWDQDVKDSISLFPLRNLTFRGDSQMQKGPNAITEILLDTLEKK